MSATVLKFPDKFFAEIRRPLFGNSLSQSQVDGMNAVFAKDAQAPQDPRWLAYEFATAYHETGAAMQPIRERGNGDGPDADKFDDYLQKYDTGRLAAALGNTPEADGDGVRWCGRGLVQITGHRNYEVFAGLLGIDLLANPDLALRLDVSIDIMFIGMQRGTFTGRKLGDYFNAGGTDWTNARKIINGTDKAEKIASHAKIFYAAIKNAA